MTVCVNVNSKEFKDTAKRLDIFEPTLENIVHEYINTEGNAEAFPSDSFILSKLEGEPFTRDLTENERKIIDLKFPTPIVTDSHGDAISVFNNIAKFIDPKHIGIKQRLDGKFVVTINTKKVDKDGNTIYHTPIKEQYKGKLIFAQSGTGKTTIADNENVIDGDYLLGKVLGVPTGLAGSAFRLLSYEQKIEAGEQYRDLIRRTIAEGKTVITANLSMLPEADVIVYNDSAELSVQRTAAADRANAWSDIDYQKQSLNTINEFLSKNPNKEVFKLGENEHLGDAILTNPNFNIFTDRVQQNTLNNLLNDFVHNFGINIEEYNGEIPLFDAVNRVIKAKRAEDIPNAVGEAVAFMMQYNPEVKRIISEMIIRDGKATREDLFTENGEIKHKYNTSEFASVKAPYFKEVGNEIANQLRRLYSDVQNIHKKEVKEPFLKRIWNIISEFFNSIAGREEAVEALSNLQKSLVNYSKKAANNILRNNDAFIVPSLSKPGTSSNELSVQVDVDKALKENPYEREIIKNLSSENIALAGSTSIAAYYRVLRPAENPFHDLDFQASNRTQDEIEGILKKYFNNFAPTNVITDKNGNVSTRSYVILNRPFHLDESKNVKGSVVLLDNATNEVIATLNSIKTEFGYLAPGIKGKVLDFFVSEDKYGTKSYTFNGENYLFSNPKNALSAKAEWMRIKDVFDINRAVPYDFVPTQLSKNLDSRDNTANKAQFHIEGKTLKNFLYQKNIIHSYDPSIGLSDKKAMYVTKGRYGESLKYNIDRLYSTLRKNGIPADAVSIERTNSGDAVKVTFNESQDAVSRAEDKNLKNINKVVDFLQERFPLLRGKVHYATIAEAEAALKRKLSKDEKSFVKGGEIYLVGRRFTKDIAIEECLHPFTVTLKYENSALYSGLFTEALNTFPKLWEEILANYNSSEFTLDDKINELVTQALARVLRNEIEINKASKLQDWVNKFINWFKNLFYRDNPYTGNHIIDVTTLDPSMKIRNLAELINTSDTEFLTYAEERTRFHKERLKISDSEAPYITENIIIPGVPQAIANRIGEMWDPLLEEFYTNNKVTMSASEWRALDREVKDPDGNMVSAISELEGTYDSEILYNENGTVTVSKADAIIMQNLPDLLAIESDLIASVKKRDPEYYVNNALDAVEVLIYDFGYSLEDLLESVDGGFYYKDSRQLSLFEDTAEESPAQDIRMQVIAQGPQETEVLRPELQAFKEKNQRVVDQLNTLLDSNLVTNEEVREYAEQAVYFFSSAITEFLENPSKAIDLLELGVVNGEPISEEERAKKVEEIKNMSRKEFVKFVTPETLIEFVKNRMFDTTLSNFKTIRKANLIKQNFEAILTFANDVFYELEDFSITKDGDAISIEENVIPEEEYSEENNDPDSIIEREGNLQDHWQIESRTQSAITRMSQLVKAVLKDCTLVERNQNGELTDITNEFGWKKHIGVKDVTSSILNWTEGAESLSHMIEMMEAKVKDNPWVIQVLDKLKDTSGQYSNFQSQFYGVFASALQPYSVVIKERDPRTKETVYKTVLVNQHPALKDAMQEAEVAFKTNMHPLFDGSSVRKDALETLEAIVGTLRERSKKSLEENDRSELVDLIKKSSDALGYTIDPSLVNVALDSNTTFHNLVNNLVKITENLHNAIGNTNYDPFKFQGENSISGYLKNFLQPLTAKLEETAVSSFYDSGKMYQSHVTPSYLSVLMNHFRGDDTRFQEFIENEYGRYEWFRDANGNWRNSWLELLSGLSQEERKNLFKHKVQLNFNKHNYMKNMSDVEYGLSILTEYFSEYKNAKGGMIPVWFRIPMMSNKPSSEFIRMYAYTGETMMQVLPREFSKIFNQELSRIQTVKIRDYGKADPEFIKNFDKNGKKFIMLDFFNKYLENGSEASSELGRLINRAIEQGSEKLSAEERVKMDSLVIEEITRSLNAKADAIIREWKNNGIFEGAKQISNLSKDDAALESSLREFIWNDTFAAMNILELTVTDPAFYKDAEDLQKRFAQIHSPGTRANVEARDYEGNLVSDGIFRTVLLKDFDDFISNIVDNINVVFDKKINNAKSESEAQSYRVLKDSLTRPRVVKDGKVVDQGGAFWNINVADAQGFSSPTSYRKKAFLFGKWSTEAENIYNRLKQGNYNYSDLKTAFQPLKPFVYGQIERPSMNSSRSDIEVPISKLKVPVQFKNSEYLLIMADAILQGEDTGKPNLLRAIYEVMEESAEKYPLRGIDTIQFESTCKSGLMAPIDIKQYYNTKGGETMAKLALERAIYREDGTYNTDTYVYEVPFENYAIQQEVPEHFKEHYQAHGSQIRYIIPSDLETVNSNGEPITYNYFDRGEEKKLSAEEFKREYENTISENIEESLDNLAKELGIYQYHLSKLDRNVALSQILTREIKSSSRYDVSLLSACTVDNNGNFNIPLGDPIQAKRIEQLLNSVIKNRINKQKIAGGPVVQVTNFGTSRELNIRFNSKDGGLLMTKEEFAKTAPQNNKSYDIDSAYKKYIEDNQAGIAYYEVFAPMFANELFSKFADENGNIDIETIEMINPDLLKMIGYRIPTEDKYSMAPLKIVGFLPREAGEGIMLPNDITLLTGSDFDVDKFYLMRKEIGIFSRVGQQRASITDENLVNGALEFTSSHRSDLIRHLKSVAVNQLYGETKLTEEEEVKIREDATESLNHEISLENERHEAALKQIEDDAADALASFSERVEAGERSESEEDAAEKKVERGKKRQLREENIKHRKALSDINRNYNVDKAVSDAEKEKINTLVHDFLNRERKIFTKSEDKVTKVLKQAYINYMFDYVEDTKGTTYRNNKIVDMSWAVLTNETTTDKMLNPGGFEPEKSMGYMISAYQNPANKYSWEELEQLANGEKGLIDGKLVDITAENSKDVETGTDALKTLCYTEKNLCFIDTHLQFYKQNSAAATALGMAAVQKVAHAVLESNGFAIDVDEILDFTDGEFFSIAGKEFSGRMTIDTKYNDEGALIGRTLGEFVAMFADAVKDPIANLMNINNTTMPIVTAMIRLGMPFRDVALFISQPIIKKVLNLYNSQNVTNFVRLSEVIEKEIKDIEDYFSIEDNSVLKELNEVTKDELIKNMNPIFRGDQNTAEESVMIDYKILKFFQYLDSVAKTLKDPTYVTRFNSVSNAVGPNIIDNLIMEYKVGKENGFKNFYKADGTPAKFNDILEMHPILRSFSKALDIAREVFFEMPSNSDNFRETLNAANDELKNILFNDRKTLSDLSDFYLSYLLVASDAIPTQATKENPYQGVKYYIEKFPMDFMRGKAKELFKGNPLIDAIKLDVQKGRAVLKIDITGLDPKDKIKLSNGWVDLYRSGERGRKLAEHLFYYNFWRTGIGFSPKSFMNLFPTSLKNKIKGYNETFTVHSDNFAQNVNKYSILEQFVRNNADNNKLVPRVNIGKDGVPFSRDGEFYVFNRDAYDAVKDKYYIKIKSGGKDILLQRVGFDKISKTSRYIEISLLGNNGEYFEASTDLSYTPLAKTEEVKQQNNEGTVSETSSVELEASEAPVVEDSITKQKKRAEKIRGMILKMFQMSGRTAEQAQDKINEFKAKPDSEKLKYKAQMKKFFAAKFKELGIEKFDDKLLEEMFNELC